jgi:hypothetical protein
MPCAQVDQFEPKWRAELRLRGEDDAIIAKPHKSKGGRPRYDRSERA